MITLTRRYRFSASHRLHTAALSDAENAALFGKCNNPYGHGHDYVLEVTAGGDLDERTGLLLPVAELDRLVTEKVLRLFAFRYINIDVPAFQTLVSTTENVALFVSDLLQSSWWDYIRRPGVHLRRVHLQETDRNGFEVLLRTATLDRLKRAEQESAKGTDARRQTIQELARSSGGALDTVPVLRVFLRKCSHRRLKESS